MDKCIRCKAGENQARLFDAIYLGRSVQICERCSIIENIPIIEKPKMQQQPESVIERMRRLSGTDERKKQDTFILKERLNMINEKPAKKTLELKEHFQWDLMRTRRRKGITQEQLANTIGVPVSVIERLEVGEIPETNAEIIIRRIEIILNINLRKIDEFEEIAKNKYQPIRLLDEYGNVLDRIPEPEIIPEFETEEIQITEEHPAEEPKKTKISFKERFSRLFKTEEEEIPEAIIETKVIEIKQEPKTDPLDKFKPYELPYTRGRIGLKKLQEIREKERIEKLKQEQEKLKKEQEKKLREISSPREVLDESGELDVAKARLTNVKIADLRELQKEKLHLTKEEKEEEAKKIERRNRLIEARKEELRLLKEKQSKNIDSLLGGSELLKKEDEKTSSIEIDESDVDRDFEEFEKD